MKKFIILALFCSGCIIFGGSYQTPKSLPAAEEETTFEDANKMLKNRLDDIASGKTKPGEAAATSSEQSVGTSSNNNSANMPPMIIDKTKNYTAILHTEAGDIEIALIADKTPITVNNFVYLCKEGFYNNTVFHRAIKGFMIQGGDPKGDGTGGPGYKFDDEKFEGEYTRGTVAMANSGANTNGSQFFIMHADVGLPKNYVIFGHVVSGMEAVDKIAEAPVRMNDYGTEKSVPLNPVKITSVDIIEK